MDKTAGALLRAQLERFDISQVAAAPQLGCSAKHLNQVLNGRTNLSVDLAISFERFLSQPGLAEAALIRQVRHELRSRGIPTSA